MSHCTISLQASAPKRTWTANSTQNNSHQGLTVRCHFKHLPPRGLGLQIQLGPQYGRRLSCVRRLSADLDLILGDIVIQTGEEVLGQVVPSIDASVVADELGTCHFFGHLHHQLVHQITHTQ